MIHLVLKEDEGWDRETLGQCLKARFGLERPCKFLLLGDGSLNLRKYILNIMLHLLHVKSLFVPIRYPVAIKSPRNQDEREGETYKEEHQQLEDQHGRRGRREESSEENNGEEEQEEQ